MDAVHLSNLVPTEIAAQLFGYIVPPLALLVLILNVLLVMTLCRRHMRSPVNALMVGIATMDTLAILLPVSAFLYFYSSGKFYDYVPFVWCRSYFTTVYVLPLMFNMASIWLTVALACVRCYSVWRPLAARARVTWYRANLVLVGTVFVSAIVYFPSLFEYEFSPVEIVANVTRLNNSTIVGCKAEKSSPHQNRTFCETHTWVQIMLTSLAPWFSMLFPNAGLLWRLRRAEIKRTSLLNETESNIDDTSTGNGEKTKFITQHSKLRKQRHKITWMIFINVMVIWLVEIPFAVVFTNLLLRNEFDFMRSNIGKAGVFVIMMKYITYPMLFLMYCLMSEKFRLTFKDIVLCRVTTAVKLFTASMKTDSTKSSDRGGRGMTPGPKKTTVSSQNEPMRERTNSL